MSEIVATPGEVPRPQTESGGAGGRAGLIWPANLLAAALLSVLSAAGAIEVTGLTAIVGSLFLVATLVPPNLNRLRRGRSGRAVRALTRLRRPLGISAGIWFVAHSIVAVIELFDFEQSLPAQFLAPDILLGVLATLVFAALLATSNARAQVGLGRRWKRLHRLVWFAVPLALVHTVLSSLRYVDHVEPPGTALLGGLALFAVVELLLLRRRGDGRSSPHLALVAAGTATALVIALV